MEWVEETKPNSQIMGRGLRHYRGGLRFTL